MNFIICEDEDIFIKNYKKIIDNFMMNYDIEYKIHIFKGYDEKFKKIAKELTGFKVYILDIKTNEGSGLSAARIIREEIEDWTSMLIMMTSYCEYVIKETKEIFNKNYKGSLNSLLKDWLIDNELESSNMIFDIKTRELIEYVKDLTTHDENDIIEKISKIQIFNQEFYP